MAYCYKKIYINDKNRLIENIVAQYTGSVESIAVNYISKICQISCHFKIGSHDTEVYTHGPCRPRSRTPLCSAV